MFDDWFDALFHAVCDMLLDQLVDVFHAWMDALFASCLVRSFDTLLDV